MAKKITIQQMKYERYLQVKEDMKKAAAKRKWTDYYKLKEEFNDLKEFLEKEKYI